MVEHAPSTQTPLVRRTFDELSTGHMVAAAAALVALAVGVAARAADAPYPGGLSMTMLTIALLAYVAAGFTRLYVALAPLGLSVAAIAAVAHVIVTVRDNGPAGVVAGTRTLSTVVALAVVTGAVSAVWGLLQDGRTHALAVYILRRLLLLIPVLVGISILTFGLAWFATGGHLENQYLDQSDRTRPEQIRRIIEEYGFDQPAYVQYFIYVKNLLTGDMGISTSVNREVSQVIATQFPASVELALVAIGFAVVFGIPLGILSAVRRDTPVDHVTRFIALSGVSVPVFWLALILQLFLSYRLGQAGFEFFPLQGRYDPFLVGSHPSLVNGATGFLLLDTLLARDLVAFADALRHMLLPAFALGFVSLGIIIRMMRASMLETLGLDYIRTARAKGLDEKVVINRHARRNALIPTTTVIGLSIGGLMGGAVLTETIFSWPGLGRWAALAILSVDVAAIMGFVVLTAIIYVLMNLLVDVLYAYLDPRVRLE